MVFKTELQATNESGALIPVYNREGLLLKLKQDYKIKVDKLYDYQRMKLESKDDDHAVCDAANDIRELKAKLELIDLLLANGNFND